MSRHNRIYVYYNTFLHTYNKLHTTSQMAHLVTYTIIYYAQTSPKWFLFSQLITYFYRTFALITGASSEIDGTTGRLWNRIWIHLDWHMIQTQPYPSRVTNKPSRYIVHLHVWDRESHVYIYSNVHVAGKSVSFVAHACRYTTGTKLFTPVHGAGKCDRLQVRGCP